MAMSGPHLVVYAVFCLFGGINGEYLGKFIGQLSELHHGVSGEVYAVDGRTIHIKDYTYDGQGPAAYFYASTYKTADSKGFRLRDENNNGDVIRRYRKEGVTLTLPEGKTLNNIKIFYVWCEEFDVNFGDVKIPRNFDYPRPQKIDALKGVHQISSDNIVIVDAQTLLIPNLHYDGEAPDAKFWAGRGLKPSPQGIRIADENGKEVPLRRYDGKTVVLTLPGDLTIFDIGHFGIWCEQFTVDFAHILIPQNVNVPPSLKMLGVSPQSKLNCEVLDDELAFEVRWAVAGESIVLQMVAKLGNREYMSFGLSGEVASSAMIGGDVVVAWVDKDTFKGYAYDYYLADKSQCSGPTGSCPDIKLTDNTNNVRLLNAAMVNGYSIVTYQRPLKASDQFDLPIFTNQSQAIIWAVGPLNQRDEVSFHTSYLKENSLIDFARPANWNCPLPEGEVPGMHVEPLKTIKTEKPPVVEYSTTQSAIRRDGGQRRRGSTRISTRQPDANAEIVKEGQASRRESTRTRGTSNKVSQKGTVPSPTPVKEHNAWYIPPIECYEPEDGVFYVQMGPTGGKRGYPAITGHVGWGISWYINGLLIPEINVVRGRTYNFITEGGDNPDISAKYHPFYITDDPVGGYAYKTPDERKNVSILAGVRYDKSGEPIPVGTGRLCHWTNTGDRDADDFDSFGAFQRTLQLKCDVGEPGIVTWTPDRSTPDTVYYQCFTHRHLGWKVHVHDTCEQAVAASELKPTIVKLPRPESDLDLETRVHQESVVMPNDFLIASHNQVQPVVSEPPTTSLDPSPTLTGHRQLLTQKHHQFITRPYNNLGRGHNFKNTFFPKILPSPRLPMAMLTTPTRPIQQEYQTYQNLTDKQAQHFIATYAIPRRSLKNFGAEHGVISSAQTPTTTEVIFEIIIPSSKDIENFPMYIHREFSPSIVVAEEGSEDKILQNKKHDSKLVRKTRKKIQVNPETEPEGHSAVIKIKRKYPFETESNKKLSIRSILESDMKSEMAASEHIESFYLPPPGTSNKSQISAAKLPSEIDFEAPAPPDRNISSKLESPPHVVVTFDGKRVSGASLTAKPFEKSILGRGSKAAELLKTQPQSIPFQGDLPPLNPNVLFHSAGLQPGVLSRNLDTPLPTKLKRLRRGGTGPFMSK